MITTTPHLNELIGSMMITFIAFATLLGFIFSLVYDFAKEKRLKSFRTQLQQALKNRELSYDDLQQVSERWKQDRKVILQSLRIVFSDALAANLQENEIIAQRARNLIELHNKSEPYAELPENISLQLDQLNRLDDGNRLLVTQLASSLSVLYATSQLESAKQKKWSFWGLIIGVIGLVGFVQPMLSMLK